MKFTLELLQEIEDYVNHLDNIHSLKLETLTDIYNAINKERYELKNLPQADVTKSVCDNCVGYKQGNNPNNYCLICKRMVEI